MPNHRCTYDLLVYSRAAYADINKRTLHENNLKRRMTTISINHQNKMFWSLVFAVSICLTSGLTLEEQVQQLKDNYIELKEDFSAKVAKLETKVARLEELEIKVQQQEILIKNLSHLQKGDEPSSVTLDSVKEGKNAILRTCRETRAADPSLSSGMYWVDPDGQGVGDDPIYVYCDMATGSTSVLHDSESMTNVGHCADPGCYSRSVNYYATARQMTALADLSSECHQSINYNCTIAALEVNGVAYSWWNDKNGIPRYFWSGNTTDAHICQCGIDQNCIESFMPCNCDSSLPLTLADNGIITDKNVLPITRLNFGRTILEDSRGLHTLGRFECTGQNVVYGMPTSCTDLWRIGHTLSGLYSVLGDKQIESVYCNFAKLPGETNFQTSIGYLDVKSSPTYFYVLLGTNNFYDTVNSPIPFDTEKINVGGAMNLSSGIFTAPRTGKYFFSFNGLAFFSIPTSQLYIDIGLFVNGVRIANGHADESNTISNWNYEPTVVQSTLHLQAGDQVSVQIVRLSSGAGLNGNSYTYFTGWLLEEDVSQFLGMA